MKKKLIDLYAYRLDGESLRFLLLKRSEEKIYAGQWRMIGGKVNPGESRWEAAARELKEETGLVSARLWSVPTLNHFYESKSDSIHLIPAFAAEVNSAQKITLDDEHTEYKWVSPEEAGSIILWPEQIRIIQMIHQIVTKRQILEEWILPDGT